MLSITFFLFCLAGIVFFILLIVDLLHQRRRRNEELAAVERTINAAREEERLKPSPSLPGEESESESDRKALDPHTIPVSPSDLRIDNSLANSPANQEILRFMAESVRPVEEIEGETQDAYDDVSGLEEDPMRNSHPGGGYQPGAGSDAREPALDPADLHYPTIHDTID